MKYRISVMNNKMEYIDQEKKFHSYTGYVFLDEFNNCHKIVYGESLRDLFKNILTIK